MSELQFDAAYHLYQNPLYPSRDIVLPSYLMYGKETRTFWCAVYGSSIVFKISVHPDGDVDDLKVKIQEKNRALRDHSASRLILWKVSFYLWDQDCVSTYLSCQLNVPAPVDPEGSLWQRIRKRGDVATFAQKISRHKMSEVFPQSRLLKDHVYILVELPSSEFISCHAV